MQLLASPALVTASLAAALSGCGARSTLAQSERAGGAASPALVDISSAAHATCGVRSDGSVVCWGAPFTEPAVVALPPAAGISVGARRACVLTEDGHVACLSLEVRSDLGEWHFGPEGPGAPVVVPGIADATQVSVGAAHSCALRAGGAISCWGDNTFGQLGNGTFDSAESPAPVGLGPALAVGAGESATCALTEAGVYCWGRALHGQLGDGGEPHEACAVNETCSPSPVLVQGLSTPESVSVGRNGACAVDGDSRVRCWGWPSEVGGHGTSPVAIEVPGALDAESVYAGDARALTIRPDGGVRGWGDNQTGVFGEDVNPTLDGPSDIVGLDGVLRVTGGDYWACALRENGEVLCWGGSNCFGEHGLDPCDDRQRYTPGLVPLP